MSKLTLFIKGQIVYIQGSLTYYKKTVRARQLSFQQQKSIHVENNFFLIFQKVALNDVVLVSQNF